MTLQEYISFWQETYDKHQSRPTTYAAHNYVFKNHILPGLGDIPLSELTSEMVGEFLEERKRFGNHRSGNSGLGEETMRHIHCLLQQCLDYAIRDLGLTNRSRVLMVGDDLLADIKGGINAGIDTCWVNFANEENKTGIQPKYTVHSYEELYRIVMEPEELENVGVRNRRHMNEG